MWLSVTIPSRGLGDVYKRQILKDAPEKFKNHPYVKEYVDIAEKNMVLLQERSRHKNVFPLQVKQQ